MSKCIISKKCDTKQVGQERITKEVVVIKENEIIKFRVDAAAATAGSWVL
jgi:hypothetical protein